MFERPPARLVDWSILVAVLAATATGLVSLVSGRPSAWWVFGAHAAVGLALVVLLGWKFARVLPRVRNPDAWERSTLVSVLLAAVAIAALATGVFWDLGGDFDVLVWNAMNVHILFGLLVIPVLLVHLRQRFRWPRRADFEGRRTLLQYGLLLGGGVLAWRLQRALVSALELGAEQRFTGSKERGTTPGNTFPVTSWVADDPDPIDPEAYALRVDGAVDAPLTLDRATVLDEDDRLAATLDCTSGWYTHQEWGGIRVGRLLAAADPADDAAWVSFRSVTGYRWSLPIGEARDALLATRVGEEPLTHGHGAPARLVAPGRRGFQWVKWVEHIEVRRTPDYGQWVAIFTSGFD